MFDLPKKYKLTSKKSIDRLFSNGNKIENKVLDYYGNMRLKVVKNPTPFKILIVFPKKHSTCHLLETILREK